ncbi:MAG: DUF4430 domain-containing protein [Actinobacteria bacterium]|nr:DUF4430 domain-containing protein [Actinomycetota bacterium]
MKVKKQTIFILIAILVLLVLIWQFIIQPQNASVLPGLGQKTVNVPTVTSQSVIPTKAAADVEVIIDFSENQRITGTVFAQTAYEALEKLAKENNLLIGVKQYQFGVMVERIGQKSNSGRYSWLYSINGKPGNTAADKYLLQTKDKVEWKYSKI